MEYCYFIGSLQVKLEFSGKFKTNISIGLKWINEMD